MENDGLGVSLLTVGTVVFHRPPRAPFRFLKDGRRGGGQGGDLPCCFGFPIFIFFCLPSHPDGRKPKCQNDDRVRASSAGQTKENTKQKQNEHRVWETSRKSECDLPVKRSATCASRTGRAVVRGQSPLGHLPSGAQQHRVQSSGLRMGPEKILFYDRGPA